MLHHRIPLAGSFLAVLLLVSMPGPARTQQADAEARAATYRGLELRAIGPGLMSGRIADIEVHPRDRATWYVGVGSGGVWKTEDDGTTWTPIFEHQGSYSIGEVTLDPTDPDVVWVGTGENVSGRHVGYGDGVYRSRDGGRTWEHLGLERSQHIGRILVDPRDPDVVLVAAEGPLWSDGGERGVYRTEDGGETWEGVLYVSDRTGATDIERDPTNPDVLYAATYERRRKIWALLAGGLESGIWKSTDGGRSWRELTVGLPSGPMGKIGLAVSPIDPQVVYATIEATPEEQGFYRSADGGESWEKRSSYVSGGTGPHYYQEIYASPHVFDRVYQMDVWMHVTNDGGRTFQELGEPDKHSDNHALTFVADAPGYLLAGSDGGLYESWDEGASWRFIANLPVTQIYKMALDDSGPLYRISGGTQDNGTIYGPGRTTSANGVQNRDWIVPYGADGYATAIEPGNPDILYVSWQNGHLLRYDRRTREPLDIQPQPAPGDPPERWNWDAPVEISPHDPARVYYGSQRLWRSDDRGSSWTPISGDLSRGRNRYELPMFDVAPGVSALYDNGAMSWYGNTTAISESPLVEGLVYVGTDDGLIQVTEDGGGSWRRVDGVADVPRTAFVNAIEASVTDPNTVFAVLDNHKEGDFSPYLVKSTDRGRSWTSITGDLPDGQILWSVAQDDEDPSLLFLGAEYGLWLTTDGGRRWTRLEGGVPVIPFRDIGIQRGQDDLVGASFGRGFFILDDYSALRGLSSEGPEAGLAPIREAYRYVPSVDLGVPGRGYQGSQHFMAPNPPFGALITYYLDRGAQTSRERREGQETRLREAGQDVPFPGWDALRAESREHEPRVILTVRDADGSVVRRLVGPDGKGFHRVAWDLRYPSPDPVELEEGAVPVWANPPVGPMVAPGTYTVELARLVDGRLQPVGEPRQVEVTTLAGHAHTGDADATLAFQRRTADVRRRAMAAAEALDDGLTRLEYMRRAVLETPDADPSLLVRMDSAEATLRDLSVELAGDRVRGRLWEPTTPSILDRVGQVSEGHWWTSEPPTGTFVRSIEIAERQLADVRSRLDRALDALADLEDALDAAGAPYTPGRGTGG